MNKAQRKARLKHLNSIRDGSYLRKKQEAQRKEKITQLLLQNSNMASWILQANQRLHMEHALMIKNHYAKQQCVNPYSKPIPQHFPIQ